MNSSLAALSTPVTCAPSRLANWTANEPEPPPAPLISTRCPAAAPAVPCSAMGPRLRDRQCLREGQLCWLVGEG